MKPEFTLEDFVHAMIDKPQYFEFFFDRARSIANNIGVRSEESQSELADIALADFYRQLDKFDFSKGKFSSWFDKCVGNKMRDELKKSRTCFRENDPHRDKIEDHDKDLFFEDPGRSARKNEFARGMLEKFMEFIDTLSYEDMLILCASEFGKDVLGDYNPENLPKGKGYAEALAQRTGRTAATVRKIAKHLKERAINYVMKNGYSKEEFDTCLGFMTYYHRPIEQEITTATLDWAALSDVQRLKLRMYLYYKAVASGIISVE